METNIKKRIFRLTALTFLSLLGIVLIYLLYHFTGIGFKCAGCGNTHALQSLLHLDIMKSFSYNYIYPIEMLYILWVYIISAKNYIKRGKFNYMPPCRMLDIIILIIVVLWIPLRNVLGV